MCFALFRNLSLPWDVEMLIILVSVLFSKIRNAIAVTLFINHTQTNFQRLSSHIKGRKPLPASHITSHIPTSPPTDHRDDPY